MKKLFTAKRTWLIIIVLIAIAGWFWWGSQNDGLPASVETGLVERGEVIEVISETGYVQSKQAIDMAFERGGRISQMMVKEGSVVLQGDVLLALDSAAAATEVSAANARLQAEQARLQELLSGADSNSLAITQAGVLAAETALENAQRQLTEVTAQQDQLVANAEKTLRTAGLQAYLVSSERENSDYTYAAPTISGTYTGNEEGFYKLALYASGATFGSSYRVTGLGSNTDSVSVVNPSPLGSDGLFIQFPANFAKGTQWEVPVPNTRSAVYSMNKNAYQSVLEGRALAIATAQSAVQSATAALAQTQSQLTQVAGSARSERVAAQQALIEQMRSALTSTQLQYDNLTLRAPFSGVVSKLHAEVGEVVAATAPALSIISPAEYELVVSISEVDIAEISLGDKAQIHFDAYDGDTFTAHVSSIAPSAELVDGVRVFKITLDFDETDIKIRGGLSADIDITTAEKTAVIAVPTRAIYEDKTGKFVRAIDAEQNITIVRLKTGLRGTNGMTEIISGLSGGEKIITFADDSALAQLEK